MQPNQSHWIELVIQLPQNCKQHNWLCVIWSISIKWCSTIIIWWLFYHIAHLFSNIVYFVTSDGLDMQPNQSHWIELVIQLPQNCKQHNWLCVIWSISIKWCSTIIIWWLRIVSNVFLSNQCVAVRHYRRHIHSLGFHNNIPSKKDSTKALSRTHFQQREVLRWRY